jgi:hypothetical protein
MPTAYNGEIDAMPNSSSYPQALEQGIHACPWKLSTGGKLLLPLHSAHVVVDSKKAD